MVWHHLKEWLATEEISVFIWDSTFDDDNSLEAKCNKLLVHAESPTGYHIVPGRPEVVPMVNLEDIIPNKFGGIGFQYTRGVGSGAPL